VTFAASAWALVKDTVSGFIDDNALSRGAAIAYYTLFSIAPVLLIIVAIAGFPLPNATAATPEQTSRTSRAKMPQAGAGTMTWNATQWGRRYRTAFDT
jgi:uncharacterized BrkB/YihY/UPF0761 family membrane protein